MIAFFRKTLASKLALGLLALIMLAFIITGVFTHELPGASSLGGPSGGSIATVGSETIGADEMEGRVRTQFAQYAQQQPGLDIATFVGSGGYKAVVDQVIGATALDAYGRSIGLVASKKQVDGEIASIPAFRGPDGKFDPQAYQAALAQQHLSEAQIRSDVGGDIVRRMLYLPASGAIKLTDGLVRPYAALLVEKRFGTIGVVPVTAFSGGAAPTDAELQNFYRSHLLSYTTPERRVVRYALIGRDQVAAAATPSEADIRKAFDAAPGTYAARETRTLSQVVLDSQAKADAFKAALAGGKSFADAAKGAGFAAADIALGTKAKADFAAVSSPQVADAAFGAAEGATTAPVKDDFGWHVVKVEAVQKIAATPFDKARPQIAADLAKANQDKALGDMIARLQDAVDGGKSFADAAKASGLAIVETPPLTPAGVAPDQPGFKLDGTLQPLMKPAFQASSDGTPTIETIQQGERYALLSVGRIVPAAPIPFAKARPLVSGAFLADRASQRAKAVAAAIEAKVKAGTSMADAFKNAGVTLAPPQPAAGRRMDLARFQNNVPPALQALFATAVGKTRVVEGGNGWFVVRTDRVEPADPVTLPAMIASSRDELAQSTSGEYLEQLAAAARKSVGVKRDEAAIAALRLRLQGVTPAQ